jgi:hypothetical protein
MSPKRAPKTSPRTEQNLLKTGSKDQAAVDRLVAAARRPTAKDKDALVQSWWDDYALGGHRSFIVTGTLIPWDELSDAQLIADEDISRDEITDARRVRFARELTLRKASGEDCYAFDAAKIRSWTGAFPRNFV